MLWGADEVDALLGKRRDAEHEAVTTMKTEFMQGWDGLLTDARANVLVLAATNRPWDLDEAVLRRYVDCMSVIVLPLWHAHAQS